MIRMHSFRLFTIILIMNYPHILWYIFQGDERNFEEYPFCVFGMRIGNRLRLQDELTQNMNTL
jgi:hypothetical protein